MKKIYFINGKLAYGSTGLSAILVSKREFRNYFIKFIGTTDGVDFRINTSNITRATVCSGGYMGTGITPETNSKLYNTFNAPNITGLDIAYMLQTAAAFITAVHPLTDIRV